MMPTAEGHINGISGGAIDVNGLLPGTTFPEKTGLQQDPNAHVEPLSFAGPDVNGRQTTVTLFSPSQLRGSPLLPSLYKVINIAFDQCHEKDGCRFVDSKRLRYDDQLFDELGTAPGTFIYIIHYTGTHEVIGTVNCKQYVGRVAVVGVVDDKTAREHTWKRFGPLPNGTAAWELSTMAVSANAQRQGIAGRLMKFAEDEIKRRFMILANEAHSDAKLDRLLIMITTIKEANFVFYSRRGFTLDYETKFEKGWLGGEIGFSVVNMSKAVDLGDLPI